MAKRKQSPAPVIVSSGPQDTSDPRGVKVAPGWIRMWSRDGDIDLLCLMGGEPPRPTRGGGGWQSSGRQGRRGRSTFPGNDTPGVDVQLLLEESVARSTTVERKVSLVETIAGVERRADVAGAPPPPVMWVGNHWTDSAHRVHGALWVVESPPEWNEQLFDDRGNLLRAQVTLSLGLYDPAALPQLARSTGFRQVTMHTGETLRDFAGRTLKDKKRWKDIAALNRTNPRCPSSPEFRVTKPVALSVPPRD